MADEQRPMFDGMLNKRALGDAVLEGGPVMLVIAVVIGFRVCHHDESGT